MELFNYINTLREQKNLMTLDDISILIERGNIVYDPFSLLISKDVFIGINNIFYPSVSILSSHHQRISIGNDNLFYNNTIIEAIHGGIVIGSDNQFGEGGCTIRTNKPNSTIEIGDSGRYIDGAAIYGKTTLGSGSQILGKINVIDCILDGGESYLNRNPDLRGAVLKGIGYAQNLRVEKGKVINGRQDFALLPIKRQSYYHPQK